MKFYEVKFLIPYPFNGIHNIPSDPDKTLVRTRSFTDYNKALRWARKWCPYNFCIVTLTKGQFGLLTVCVENFESNFIEK